MATQKKVVHVAGGDSHVADGSGKFTPTSKDRNKAVAMRIIAGIMWLVAIAAQIVAIAMLFRPPVNMTWLIILIAIDLVAVVAGSMLWKKSNRLDPASEKQKFRFFMQNQLGAVAAVVAFAPLVIFVLSGKNLDKKQKGVLGGIAGAAMVVAFAMGIDFNPPSVEEYTEEANRVEWLNNGQNDVYWTKYGTVYHIFDDCPYINTSRTDQIYQGTVAQAHEDKNIERLCSYCENRSIKEKDLMETDYVPAVTGADPSGM